MSYIKSLQAMRKTLDAEGQAPAVIETPPTGPKGLMARPNILEAPKHTTDLKYDPNQFVLDTMKNIRASRKSLEEKLFQQVDDAKEDTGPVVQDERINRVVEALKNPQEKEVVLAERDRQPVSGKGNQNLHVDTTEYEREGVDVLAMSRAVKDIESGGGNYQARGPVVKSGRYAGERALGAYQVMPGNLPAWSRAALGYEVSEKEFLADPAIQDTIFLHQMSQNIDRYGSAEDAVSVWFSGRPLAKAQNASDGYMSAPDYVSNYKSGYSKKTRS